MLVATKSDKYLNEMCLHNLSLTVHFYSLCIVGNLGKLRPIYPYPTVP